MKTRIKLIVVFFISTYSILFAQTWVNYTVDNSGLPSNKISSITIIDETIWVTTDSGIASFDGINWNTYSTTEGISSEITNGSALQSDTINILCVATNNGVNSFNVENLFIISEIEYWNKSNANIISDSINSIGISYDSNKWLGTDKGISVITPIEILNLQVGTTGIKLNNNQITSFSISSDTVFHRNKIYIPTGGVMYVATNGGGVSRFYNHEVDGISSASIVQNKWSGLPSDTVLTVFVDKQNAHWYGTTEGVSTHLKHDSKNAEWHNYTIDDGLIDNRVVSITADSNGQMWFGTQKGISMFDGLNWKSFSEENGLVSNNVTDIEVDSKNNIWIATDKGLSKLSELTLDVKDNYEISNKEINSFTVNPNPFNLNINLSFTISKNARVVFQIYNMLGEKVKEIKNDYFSKGNYTLNWDARNDDHNIVNSGIYLVRMETSNMIITKKIILLK